MENPFAIARPRPGDVRASMRGLGEIKGASPFKRGGQEYSSLRVNELPSNVSRKEKSRVSLILEETFENEETKNEINEMILQMSRAKLAQQAAPEPVSALASDASLEVSFTDLSTLPPFTATTPVPPAKTATSSILSTPPADPNKNTNFQMNNNDNGFKAPVLNGSAPTPPSKVPPSPEGDNPWDLVPDQPKIKIHSRSNSKTDNYKSDPIIPPPISANPADKWLASLTNKIASVEDNRVKSSWGEDSKKVDAWNNSNGNHVEDPLEIQWAGLANRNVVKPAPNGNNTNPFRALV